MPARVPKHPVAIPPLEAFLGGRIRLVDRDGVPEQYHVFDRDSAQAVRAALAARRPLLVRGEPGVGKTQLAAAAARVLRRPLVPHVVDSRTESRDLLWTFDAVMRLADAQAAAALLPGLCGTGPDDPASGRPTMTKQDLRAALDPNDYVRPGPLWWAFDWDSAREQAQRSAATPPAHDPGDEPRNGRVLLLDEIDKADSDVPNGLLEALGAGCFTPPGRAEPVTILEPAPLVVITTNEERVLPAAFVRRCLVLHLALPLKEDELVAFLVRRAEVHFGPAEGPRAELYSRAATMIAEDRTVARERFVKPLPGQAEFLDLLRAVLELETTDGPALSILDAIKPYVLKKQEEPGS
jgi:MoxR-like ATPase